jgi:hypothetical protein
VIKGSFLMEFVLWLFFIVPGVIYTVWRLTTVAKGCPVCGAESMIPVHSPMGRKLQKEFDRDT